MRRGETISGEKIGEWRTSGEWQTITQETIENWKMTGVFVTTYHAGSLLSSRYFSLSLSSLHDLSPSLYGTFLIWRLPNMAPS